MKPFAICNSFFCMQDFRSWIAQIEYQGQARNTRILERKPLINTSYGIRHGLELKYFHFAQFLLVAHWAAYWPRKSENRELEIQDRSLRSSYGWLVSNTVHDKLQRQIAVKSLNRKSKLVLCQRWSLHGFQTSHFIYYQLGCKLWLQLTQDHTRHRFQAFARRHLKSLSPCADRFESEQTPFPWTGRRLRSAALHRILFRTCCFVPMSCFYSGTNEWSQD